MARFKGRHIKDRNGPEVEWECGVESDWSVDGDNCWYTFLVLANGAYRPDDYPVMRHTRLPIDLISQSTDEVNRVVTAYAESEIDAMTLPPYPREVPVAN